MADPLSVLGLGVGAASFILQITDECIKRYKYFTEAVHMSESYRYLRVRVQIEQQRFLSFALEAGLLHQEGRICETLQVNHLLLKDVLIEINSLFQKYERKNGRYANIVGQRNISCNDKGEPQTNLMELLCANSIGSIGSNDPVEDKRRFSLSRSFRKVGDRTAIAARKLRTILIEPKRLVWVSVDKEAFETLVGNLKDLNSFLIGLLDTSHIRRLENDVEMNYLELLQLRNDVQSLRILIQALDRDAMGFEKTIGPIPVELSQNPLSESTIVESNVDYQERRQDIRKLARLKLRHMEIDQSPDPGTSIFYKSMAMFLDISLFDFCAGVPLRYEQGRRSVASWDDRNVWVEWIEQSPHCLEEHPAVSLSEKRVSMLTRLLHEEIPPKFRAPRCLGYTKSSTRNGESSFGIVFESPSDIYPDSTLKTLHQLLTEGPKPPIATRISLCSTLADCLFSFHSVEWLHKGLKSNNILFFCDGKSNANISMPYITGYDLSRPTNVLEMTAKPPFDPWSDIYRHPHAQFGEAKNHYRKSYDMYSLGVMLIEIAIWSPIEDILAIKDLREMKSKDLRGIAGKLLGLPEDGETTNGIRSPIEEAASECGNSYRDIVEICLEANEVEKPAYTGESSTSIKSRLRMMFREQVTEKLRLMKEVLSSSK
ncbi:prion-inhibition and propagation-domain-containing protein [Annulohypoxylon truncatum]|uniref:prion-inhibition and propagation-domain-containing protein n=1 Tax=Annulohypoxylon truncatum TaxID=327061 RepID=UPI002008D7F0|nr:prion-inhibition and propagation-domain-containing protein [Annulohypoxylon truncatum]KAI1210054.1 prion-inhibition and propagation-domain-containing protein [Annulohypoxylon truncatum]